MGALEISKRKFFSTLFMGRHQKNSCSSHAGFTLIEIVLLMGIMVVILGIVFSSFASFRRTSLLNSGTEIAVSALYRARSETISSRGASSYGVHFAGDRVVLFKGTTYSAGGAGNSEIIFSQGVEISSIVLNGGGSDLVFDRITGATSQYGSVTVRSPWDLHTRVISILKTGIVSVQ